MQNVLDDLQAILTQITSGHGDPKELAAQALVLTAALRHHAGDQPFKLVRGGAEVLYSVEQSANGETLTERRNTGTAKPFRCPKTVYDALVVALVVHDRALPLDELLQVVGERIGDQPPDFQVRVPLRLWMQVQPPLLVRNRARYRPVDSATFPVSANEVWANLKPR